MAKSKDGVNKSEEVRKLLTDNPKMSTKDIKDTLGQRGISVTGGLIYFIKGKLKGKKRKQDKAKVARATLGNGDPVALIQNLKSLAFEVGGMKKLQALVEALSE